MDLVSTFMVVKLMLLVRNCVIADASNVGVFVDNHAKVSIM